MFELECGPLRMPVPGSQFLVSIGELDGYIYRKDAISVTPDNDLRVKCR